MTRTQTKGLQVGSLTVTPKAVVVLTTQATRHGGHYLTWESQSGPAVPSPVSFDTAFGNAPKRRRERPCTEGTWKNPRTVLHLALCGSGVSLGKLQGGFLQQTPSNPTTPMSLTTSIIHLYWLKIWNCRCSLGRTFFTGSFIYATCWGHQVRFCGEADLPQSSSALHAGQSRIFRMQEIRNHTGPWSIHGSTMWEVLKSNSLPYV